MLRGFPICREVFMHAHQQKRLVSTRSPKSAVNDPEKVIEVLRQSFTIRSCSELHARHGANRRARSGSIHQVVIGPIESDGGIKTRRNCGR